MSERKEGVIALFNIDSTLTHLRKVSRSSLNSFLTVFTFFWNNKFSQKKTEGFLVSNTHVVTSCNKRDVRFSLVASKGKLLLQPF